MTINHWVDAKVRMPEKDGVYLIELQDGYVSLAYLQESTSYGMPIGQVWYDETGIGIPDADVAYWCAIPLRKGRDYETIPTVIPRALS